jgi:hypothetical protein
VIKLTKDHIWHIAIVDFVDLHRDTLAIIPDLNDVALWVDSDLDHVLSLVILVVVCRIYQNLIYNNKYFD